MNIHPSPPTSADSLLIAFASSAENADFPFDFLKDPSPLFIFVYLCCLENTSTHPHW